MIPTKTFQNNRLPLASRLQYDIAVAEGVLMLKDGSFMASFEYRGPDLSSSTIDEVNALAAAVSRALGTVEEQCMLHIEHARRPIAKYADSYFKAPVPALLDTVRRLRAEAEGARYSSSQVITLTWLPPSAFEQNFLSRLISGKKNLPASDAGSERALLRQNLARFKLRLEDFAKALKACHREIKVFPLSTEKLLAHINFALSGKRHSVRVPNPPLYLDFLLGSQDFIAGLSPKMGDKHIRCLSIEQLPGTTHPTILSILTRTALEFRWSTRWIPFSREMAEKQIKKFQQSWRDAMYDSKAKMAQHFGGGAMDVNGHALSQAQEAGQALNLARSGQARFGYYSSTVVVMHENEKFLDDVARDIQKTIEALGFVVRLERFHAVEAFFGSLPGHAFENVRKPIIHTGNLSDLVALHSVWNGHETSPNPRFPANAAPHIVAKTTGGEVFNFNLYASDVPDLGHATVIGKTGSGKSALLTLMMAQFLRYHYPEQGRTSQVFMFDKGASSFVFANAAGGEFYELAGDNHVLSFAPLVDVHLPGEQEWACAWIEGLVLLQSPGEAQLSASTKAAIRDGVRLLADNRPEDRTLTHLVGLLTSPDPSNPGYFRERLGAYTLDSGTMAGKMLDGTRNDLGSGYFQVFETDYLMTNLSSDQVMPILSYLFHVIERRTSTGVPALIVIDEAWAVLSHPYFRERIIAWLRTMRRSGASVVFATQNIADVLKSEAASEILGNVATQIWLPNGEAQSSFMSKFYEDAGLTPSQIESVARAQPRKEYLLRNSDGARWFDADLSELEICLLAKSGKTDIALARQMIAEHGDNWVEHWLEHWGFPDWASYYVRNLKGRTDLSNKPA